MGQTRYLIDEFPFFSKTGYSMPFSAHIRVPLIPEVSGTLPDQVSMSILTCVPILRPVSPLSQHFFFTTRLVGNSAFMKKLEVKVKFGPYNSILLNHDYEPFLAICHHFLGMKCHTCPDVCSGHLSGVYRSIFTWVGENLVCLYHVYSHKTQFPQNWKKKHFLSGKKLISKMALFFAFWRKYGTRYSILGVPYFLGFCF